jgi:hypothetical protein
MDYGLNFCIEIDYRLDAQPWAGLAIIRDILVAWGGPLCCKYFDGNWSFIARILKFKPCPGE